MPEQKSYTVEFKLSVIKWYKENGGSIRKTATEYGIDRKRIREWLKQEEELDANFRGSGAKKRRIHDGAEVISQTIEFGVLDYLFSERKRGIEVHNKDLKDKALEIAKDLIQQDPNPKLAGFKASNGWLQRWKKRNRISLLRETNESQKVPTDHGTLIKGHQHTLYNIEYDMSGRQTRSSRQLKNVKEEANVNSGEFNRSPTYTLSPSQSTRSALRGKSPLPSACQGIQTLLRQVETKRKPQGVESTKSTTKEKSGHDFKRICSKLSEIKAEPETRSTTLKFDHYKSKDKSFTSASHVKVVRSLSGETETGRKIYSVSVSEASPKTSPKTSPKSEKSAPKSNLTSISKPEDDSSDVPMRETQYDNILCDNTEESLERIEFEDGIVFEIGEEEFGEINTSQESFDSSYSSQEVLNSQKSSQETEGRRHYDALPPGSQESGLSLTASQESGMSSQASVDLYSDVENYLDGKIHQLSSVDVSKGEGETWSAEGETWSAKGVKWSADTQDEEAKSPVSYPSNQSQFFGMFGLVKKSDVPVDDPTKSKLHRAVGGKLRRTVRPNVRSEMVYTKLTKLSLFDDVSVEDDDEESIKQVSTSSRDNSPRILNRTEFLQQEQMKQAKYPVSPKTTSQYSEQISKVPIISLSQDLNYPALAPKPKLPVAEKTSKLKEKRKNKAALKGAPVVKKPKLEPAESSLSKSPVRGYSSSTVTTKMSKVKCSPIKDKVRSSLDKLSGVKPDSLPGGSEVILDEIHIKEEPMDEGYGNAKFDSEDQESSGQSRRSGRNAKRKEWKHLLRANPDVYENITDLEKQQQFVSKPPRGQITKGKVKPLTTVDGKTPHTSPVKNIKKFTTYERKCIENRRRRDCERETKSKFDKVDSSESYLDLYEEVVEKKGCTNTLRLRKTKDWALAKMMLTRAEEMKKAKETDPEQWAKLPGLAALSKETMGEDYETSSALPSVSKGKSSSCDKKDTGLSQGIVENTKDLLDAMQPMLDGMKTEPEDCAYKKWMKDIEVVDPPTVVEENQEDSYVFGADRPQPHNFMDILKFREEMRLQKLDEHEYAPSRKNVPLSFKNTLQLPKSGCLIPHMCNVCWVNDHMYCSNMKRTSRNLPPYGGCLHYITCEHYSRSGIAKALDEKQHRLITRGVVGNVPVIRVQKEEDAQTDVDILGNGDSSQDETEPDLELECEEEMHTSDNEFTPPEGTELLQTHLKARGEQIKKSLGVAEHQPVPKQNGEILFQENNVEEQTSSGKVLWSAHGAEIIVASENTWYYPPKHLNILYGNEIGPSFDGTGKTFFLSKKVLTAGNDEKHKENKSKTTTRVHIKVMPSTVNADGETEVKGTTKPADTKVEQEIPSNVDGKCIRKNKPVEKKLKSVAKVQNVDDIKHPCTEIVRIQYKDSDKILVQHVLGEGSDEIVRREEEISNDDIQCHEQLQLTHAGKADQQCILGYVLAKEAVKLLCNERCSNLISQSFSVKVSHDGAVMTVKNEKASKKIRKKVICKKNYIHVNSADSRMLRNVSPQVMWDVQNVESGRKRLVVDAEKLVQTFTEKVNKFLGRTEIKDSRQWEFNQERHERDKKIGNFGSNRSKEEDPLEAASRILDEIKWLKQQRLTQLGSEGEEGNYLSNEEGEEESQDEEVQREDIAKNDPVVAALVSVARSLAESERDSTIFKNVSPKYQTKESHKSGQLQKTMMEDGSPIDKQSDAVKKSDTQQPQESSPESCDDSTKVAGDASAQTLTFSTKDIREKRPHLIVYIKKAALAPVICMKLGTEKRSLEKVLGKVDALFTKLKAELEQKNCLLAAVRSEKYWLEDRQKSFSGKIMTAVDHSVEVTKHLKTVQRSKNKIQLCVERCNEMLNTMQTIQKNKGEIDPNAENSSQKPLGINQTTDTNKRKKPLWFLTDKGEYAKEGSSGVKRRKSEENTPQDSISDTSKKQTGSKVSPGNSSKQNNPDGIYSLLKIGQNNDSDRSSIDSTDMEVSVNLNSSDMSLTKNKIGRKLTVRQLLDSHRRGSSDSRSASPASSLDTPRATPEPPAPSANPGESLLSKEESHKSALGRSVLIKPITKGLPDVTARIHSSEGQQQDVKTIYVSTISSKPKSSVIIGKKLGNSNISSQMPILIPRKENAEFLSSLINNSGGDTSTKVLEKIRGSANNQTAASSQVDNQAYNLEYDANQFLSSADLEHKAETSFAKAQVKSIRSKNPEVTSTGQQQKGVLKLPKDGQSGEVLSDEKKVESKTKPSGVRPRMVKLTPEMLDKLIESGAAQLTSGTKVEKIGHPKMASKNSDDLNMGGSTARSNLANQNTAISSRAIIKPGSSKTRSVINPARVKGVVQLEISRETHPQSLSTASPSKPIEIMSIRNEIRTVPAYRRVSESGRKGVKITVQSQPMTALSTAISDLNTAASDREALGSSKDTVQTNKTATSTVMKDSASTEKVASVDFGQDESLERNQQVLWADLPLEQLQTVLRDSELTQADVNSLMYTEKS